MNDKLVTLLYRETTLSGVCMQWCARARSTGGCKTTCLPTMVVLNQ